MRKAPTNKSDIPVRKELEGLRSSSSVSVRLAELFRYGAVCLRGTTSQDIKSLDRVSIRPAVVMVGLLVGAILHAQYRNRPCE